MKKVLLIPALAVLAVLLASGCTQLDDVIARDEFVTITNVPFEGGIDTEDCGVRLLEEYPDAENYDCSITEVDNTNGVATCRCVIHRGMI